jgi:hypothetical protein
MICRMRWFDIQASPHEGGTHASLGAGANRLSQRGNWAQPV